MSSYLPRSPFLPIDCTFLKPNPSVFLPFPPHRATPHSLYLSSLSFIYSSHLSLFFYFISPSDSLRLPPPDTRYYQTWGRSTTTTLNAHCNRLPNTITAGAGIRYPAGGRSARSDQTWPVLSNPHEIRHPQLGLGRAQSP